MSLTDAVEGLALIHQGLVGLQDVYDKMEAIGGKATEVVGRLLVFKPLLELLDKEGKAGNLHNNKGGRLEEPGQLQALKRLRVAVQQAEKLVQKQRKKAGSSAAWARAWSITADTGEFDSVQRTITQAVDDLMVVETFRQSSLAAQDRKESRKFRKEQEKFREEWRKHNQEESQRLKAPSQLRHELSIKGSRNREPREPREAREARAPVHTAKPAVSLFTGKGGGAIFGHLMNNLKIPSVKTRG